MNRCDRNKFEGDRNCKIQGDSKRWTQLKSERRLNTRQTVGCGIPSSLLAVRVDLRGLSSKRSWIRLTFSSDTRKYLVLHSIHFVLNRCCCTVVHWMSALAVIFKNMGLSLLNILKIIHISFIVQENRHTKLSPSLWIALYYRVGGFC